ncbi:Rv0361 family membrane protein [Mycobacteroides abscessus]|uniref:Rv0361 family membrane protein n=1 Tax=Mycobacteroides abscessus TaxID=36809 RepID=UPI0005DC73BB|nr:hypothetical protein [Mycobacteroides abscessus]MBE5511390.1 hypothetical protein [Mycobacteroides abscessus]MBN7385474.1 hypothetical protein [Mycobacteroides abscessus subsp. abscessus]MBN7414379.1 hypothetical protein [Mycobacteroides abscessus subsp. abscessus]MBN7486154.1 hypothetical protein [Mycobacteroides abscessus subsp. abscessus]MBN7501550.1 hypothetical protein [Mycobacteroides abscessus subsp. abscessus]
MRNSVFLALLGIVGAGIVGCASNTETEPEPTATGSPTEIGAVEAGASAYLASYYAKNIVEIRELSCGELRAQIGSMSDEAMTEKIAKAIDAHGPARLDGFVNTTVTGHDGHITATVKYEHSLPDDIVTMKLANIDGRWKVCTYKVAP